MNFFIISAERFNLSKEENAKRTMAMAATLLHEGADFITCHGVYKGTAERSFMVIDHGLPAGLVDRLAKAYEQESVLEVRDLESTLVYFNGLAPLYLGSFEQHRGPVAGLEAYTRIGNEIYVVTK